MRLKARKRRLSAPEMHTAHPPVRRCWRLARERSENFSLPSYWQSGGPFLSAFPPQHDEHKSSKHQNSSRSGHPQNAQSHRRILRRMRVEVITEQQNLIDRIADLILRSLNQRKPHVFRRILDPVEI